MEPSKQTLLVAGLSVDVYSHPSATDHHPRPCPLLPPRQNRFQSGQGFRRDHKGHFQPDLRVRYFKFAKEERSHRRQFRSTESWDKTSGYQRNLGWNEHPEHKNDQYAVDMYTIQTGTAQDVSFLIDHLPSFLYPAGQRTIVEWGIGGVSFGGHSTWIALSREPRLKVGIPIVGCPDYTKLISQRAESSGIPLKPPYYSDSLKTYVDANDPAKRPYRTKHESNPFLGRKILVLSGAKDTLVPWVTSTEFVQNLEVGEGGIKRVLVDENAGHEWTPKMQHEAGLFINEWLNNGWNTSKL